MLVAVQPTLATPPEGLDVQQAYPEAERRLQARFHRAGLHYPPERAQLIALKESRRVELWAWEERQWQHIHDYPVFAASGQAGPKLKEGDKQVPEGFYRIEALNPNSHFHLSLKLDYPNTFDWKNASEEGRTKPGSNIFIHGSAWSTGCLAMGNRGVEELYTLAASTDMERMHVLIVPYDFRERRVAVKETQPAWVAELYAYLRVRIGQFPLTDKIIGCSADCLARWERLTYKEGEK